MLPGELAELLTPVVGVIDSADSIDTGVGKSARIVADGRPLFVKYELHGTGATFGTEREALGLLGSVTGRLPTPDVVDHRDAIGDWSWIVLDWHEAVPPESRHWEALGRGLALMHISRADLWGWDRDGWLGPLPQDNTPRQTWAEFWVENRIVPQLVTARNSPDIGSDADWETLLGAVPDLLAPAESEGPTFLHGDLWVGNVLMSVDGPMLVDPSFYFGHREVDMAMAALFKGFPEPFWTAYEAAAPLQPGWEARRSIYQLYYLLAHVTLFNHYQDWTRETLRAVLEAITD